MSRVIVDRCRETSWTLFVPLGLVDPLGVQRAGSHTGPRCRSRPMGTADRETASEGDAATAERLGRRPRRRGGCRASRSPRARRGRSDPTSASHPSAAETRFRPAGTRGTPTSASRSAQSGGAHARASTPSARNRTASPTSGSTSPLPPYVDNNTRISESHRHRFGLDRSLVGPAEPNLTLGHGVSDLC